MSWENPTEYVDGSPAEDRSGTTVYWLEMATLEYGTVYVQKGAESVEVPGLDPAGDYRVGAAAYNEDGAKGELAVAEVE